MAFLAQIQKKEKATYIPYAEYLTENMDIKSNLVPLAMTTAPNDADNDHDEKKESQTQPPPPNKSQKSKRKKKGKSPSQRGLDLTNKALRGKDGKLYKLVKILMISDTHMLHEKLNMETADILVVSGDYTNHGTIKEAESVNEWLGKMKTKYKYKHILLINGNHEGFGDIVLSEKYMKYLDEQQNAITQPEQIAVLMQLYDEQIVKLRQIMSHCTILHEEAMEIEGIKFYGTAFSNHTDKNYGLDLEPMFIEQQWQKIPDDVEYLVTHCPPQGILDRVDTHSGCSRLRMRVSELKALKVHQFGHVHGVSDYVFVEKQSLIDSAKLERRRGLHANGKPYFFCLDRKGEKLKRYKDSKQIQEETEKEKVHMLNDCVLFANCVNDGTEQAMWLYFPVLYEQQKHVQTQ